MKLPKAALASLLVILLQALSLQAQAALTDAQANRQIDSAINTQYASADIDLAEKTLLGIVKQCAGGCSQGVIARAWMYVGIVRGSGRDDVTGATEAFAAAKAADPNVALDELFATDVVKRVFAQTPAPAAGETMPLMDDIRERAGEEEEVSAITCSLVATKIETQRPIPISCRVPNAARSVTLWYRHEQTTHWRDVALTKTGRAWVGEIPCAETKQIGVMGYRVEALDAKGAAIDNLGDEVDPLEFGLVQETDEAAPSLPGQPAPKSCRPVKKPEPAGPKLGTYGDSCDSGSECQGGLTCSAGKCAADMSCESDAECFSGTCDDGVCSVSTTDDCEEGQECDRASRAPGNWFGLQGGIDFAMMSGSQVCGGNADVAFSCFNKDGSPYRGLPNQNYAGGIDGGFRTATARLMLSYERSLGSLVSLEGRVGFAFNGGPESPSSRGGDGSTFLPVHAEARAKLYFTGVYSEDGRGLQGPSGFVMLGGGLAQVDPKVSVPVAECRESDPNEQFITEREEACITSDNRAFALQEVDVYQRLGRGFVTTGIGFRWGFGKHMAAVAAVNVQVLVPSIGFTLSPSLGVLAGF